MAKKRPETLDDLLDAKGIGTTEAAQRADISPRALLNWRRGIGRPWPAKLAALAKVLGVEPARVRAAVEAASRR